jgi:hypothetical protein
MWVVNNITIVEAHEKVSEHFMIQTITCSASSSARTRFPSLHITPICFCFYLAYQSGTTDTVSYAMRGEENVN